MRLPGADTVVVRYSGEIGTKSSAVQRRMERRLADNLEAMLAERGVPGEVELHPTRPLVRTDGPVAACDAAEAAADVFGVVSASPARSVPPEFDAILDALADAGRACYDGGSFAVSARRAGTDYPFTSHDVEVDGGAAVYEAVADRFEPAVDLDDPDHTFGVEVRPEEAFVYTETAGGPGGLPLGSQAPLVALVSGGIDSPVAAYEVMRRGSPIVPVYLELGEFGGPDHEARAMETVTTLSRYAPGRELPVWRVPAGDDLADFAAAIESGRMLVFRRYMYAVAGEIARREGAHGVVTGEALGQKSSQTAQNLAVTSAAIDLPVHRPLLSMDKAAIVERAREIGTFADSTIPAGCNRLAPSRPETRGSLAGVEGLEPDDLAERAERAASRAERVAPVELPDVTG